MRLLERNARGEIHLTKDLLDREIPRYAILSHTWGNEEVLFQDLTNGVGEKKPGYIKIQFCGDQARRDGLQYFWVDTCCIDKANKTELEEAINSMFRWYRNADKCYVYLADVSTPSLDAADKSSWELDFRKSRWFTRGWTLQELIAPESVEFFSREGVRLGDRKSLEHDIRHITALPLAVLRGSAPSGFSVPERLEWVKKRETTKQEDKAYSLLGIFGIHMRVTYGEGEENTFRRLLKKIEGIPEIEAPSIPIANDATFDVRADAQAIEHMLEAFLPSRPRETMAGKDPSGLAGLRTTGREVDKRRLEEANRDWLNDTCEAHHEDSETARPSKRSNLGSMSGEERSATAACGGDSDSIDATIKQSLVDQLYFTKIDERLTNLSPAQGKTCRWFLAKPEYTVWRHVSQQSGGGGFLWIKGNPGTGKSTLMKLLFEEARLDAKGDPSQITLSFFFLARGAIEEKSTIGLYRSLLHQLFEKAPDLKDSLEWMTANGAKGIALNGWHESALKQTLTHAIRKLGSRALTIFVDALDECDQSQTASMVCFFEELCDHVREAQVQLRICFSSRHYPTVVIREGAEVTLEDEDGHIEDIQHYIRSKLRLGRSKDAEPLRSEILEKSSRIFLWVVLVLDILNAEYPNSSVSIKQIRRRLREIPPGLNDLFEMILARDGENIEQLQICLKWILFAAGSLKPQELYFAIQLGLDGKSLGYWDKDDIELDEMKTFVRTSSKGLAEVTRNKASEVQFIHESVRDFLLAKYREQWSEASGNVNGHCHNILRNCCLAQLNASIDQEVEIPVPRVQGTDAAARFRETVKLKFPFLEYSVFNVLHHANSAQQHGMEQEGFLASFPIPRWVLLNNAFERHAIRRYTKSVSLLYLLAERNLAGLIRIHPQAMSCFDVGYERYGPPIFAALATDSNEAIESFFDICSDTQPQRSLPRDLWKQVSGSMKTSIWLRRQFTFSRNEGVLSYITKQDDDVLLSLFIATRQANTQDKHARSPLSYAAERGHKIVATMLLNTTGIDIESKDRYSRTPLFWAAEKGQETIVRLLLEKGADLKSKDNRSWTPLVWAVQNGHETIVQLLLENGADVESKDSFSRTPLVWAAQNGHETIVQLLLKKGADVESKGGSRGTPLVWAAQNRQETIVQLLLENGADVEVDSNWTPLVWAAQNGHETIVQLLLKKGADVKSKGGSRGTPLVWAAQNGHETIVRLLLENGADLKSKDDQGCTPLSWAVQNGHETIVQLLLENGADVESKDSFSRTLLVWAAQNGHETIVQLLLENGAKADSKKQDGQTLLSLAAGGGHIAVVRLLLDTRRPEVNTKDEDGRTPLLYAAVGGCEAVVRLLLETGNTDIDAKDENGRTPLAWAAKRGHDAVVRLLLDNSADVESIDSSGETPLSWAVKERHEAVVKLLLDTRRTEVNTKDEDGRTPLLYAAMRGYEAVVRLLLETGNTDVDAKDNNGRTPLAWAAERGYDAVVRLLLDNGANFESVDSSGRMPLSWALKKGHKAVVKLLVDAGNAVIGR